MIKICFVLVLFSIRRSIFSQGLDQISVIDDSICLFYKLIEDQFKCGINGYPINYGYKNCMIFTNQETLEKFSADGRRFVNCSTLCLIRKIKLIAKESTTCEQIQDDAFKSHVDCYAECDFCEICKTQKAALLKSYDWSDFMSTAAVKQIYSIIGKCGFFNCF